MVVKRVRSSQARTPHVSVQAKTCDLPLCHLGVAYRDTIKASPHRAEQMRRILAECVLTAEQSQQNKPEPRIMTRREKPLRRATPLCVDYYIKIRPYLSCRSSILHLISHHIQSSETYLSSYTTRPPPRSFATPPTPASATGY